MEDQVASFTRKGVKAVHVKEETISEETVEEIHKGDYQLLFFSPEAILTEESWRDIFQSQVYGENVVGFVVDEAHCEEVVGMKLVEHRNTP